MDKNIESHTNLCLYNDTSHQGRRQSHKGFNGVVLYEDAMHNSLTDRSEAFGSASCSALHASWLFLQWRMFPK